MDSNYTFQTSSGEIKKPSTGKNTTKLPRYGRITYLEKN